MHQGNWKCSSCNGPITELPFIPRSEAGLTCRTCYSKKRNTTPNTAPTNQNTPPADEVPDIPDYAEVANEPAPMDDFHNTVDPFQKEKPKFSGEWECSMCGGVISSLPFEPRNTSNLKCLECFKQSKN